VRALAEDIDDPELAIELGVRSCQMLVELGWRLGLTEEEAEELLREGEVWARKRIDPRALASLYSGASMLVSIPLAQMKRGQELAAEALRLAQTAGDEPLIFMNELRVCLTNLWAGDLRAAHVAIEAANAHGFAVMNTVSPMLAYDASAYAPGLRGVVAQEHGQLEESLRWLDAGIARARERDAIEPLCWLLSGGSAAHLDLGDLSRASSMAREAMEIAEGIGDVTTRGMAESALCRVSVSEGDLEMAISLAERWIETARIGVKFQLPWALSTLAVLRSACGEPEEARRLAHEALAAAESGGYGTGKLWSELALARICLDDGDRAARDEAADWLTRAEASLDTTGAFARLPDLLELRAGLARQRGDAPGREVALREALRIFQERGATPHAERIARELES
jgi:ATP/maltotriose-dependent transcriptional regulator MalT